MKYYILLLFVVTSASIKLNAQNQILLNVSGTCSMCKDRIESRAVNTKDVLIANYDIDKQILVILTKDGFIKDSLITSLLAIGHDTEGLKALDDVYSNLPECCHYRENELTIRSMDDSNENKVNTISFQVSGECGMCAQRIEKIALSTIGVNSANYDLENKSLTIGFDESLFLKKELVNALLNAGHDTDGNTSTLENYSKLPACCKYRETSMKPNLEDEHNENENHSDHSLSGIVYEKTENDKMLPLIGATLNWLGTKDGVTTDVNGRFSIHLSSKSKYLIVSYVGYIPDTLKIEKAGTVNIIISESSLLLPGVEITHKRRSSEISYLETVKTLNISSKELLKAACCNLAESFDTTPAVDASTTDAVTGTRRIEMLGLAGPYVQITRENIPDVRGLAAIQGLSYTPGPWVEGMQLNMGAGSVVNGFESITGQINVELRKPCHEDKMYFNAYANQSGRFEMNTFAKAEINEKWSTASLLHASIRNQRRDHNHDNFLDMPLGKQIGFINRWKWSNNNGQEAQIGMKLTFTENISGQVEFNPLRSDRRNVWGADMLTNRAEVWAKRGFVNLDTPYKTLGFQISAVYHDQKAQFGLRRYDANQKSLYFNMIYQSIIDNTNHQIRMGTSFQFDQFDEFVINTQWKRNEWVPGIFSEYTYKGSEKFSLLIGGRADYHNNFGLFFTPRLNLRYAPNQSTVVRLAAGRGQKTASIFAENIGIFASNREIIVEGNKPDTPYGLDAEVAWNLGVSLTKEFSLSNKILSLSIDLNRINFENQIIIDFDRSARSVVFYNLNGKSFSNSAQVQIETDPVKWVGIRIAYRYNDVQTTYGEQLLRKPLVSPQRAFANLDLKLGKRWVIDYTLNWLSSVRIPSTLDNDSEHQLDTKSPSYFLSNTQISKSWKNNFEVYVGGENIFNYKMENPILSSHAPFSQYFDSSLAWGPIMGINIYAGIRYSIK